MSTKPGATTLPSASIVRVAGVVDVADGRDAAVADADVGEPAGRTGAVDDRAAADDHVEHGPTIVQPPWVMHLPAGSPSSPGRPAGIGAAIARRFARRGRARSRSSPGSLEPGSGGHLAGRCGRRPTPSPRPAVSALPIVADLSDPACDRAAIVAQADGRARPGRRARQQRGRVLLPERSTRRRSAACGSRTRSTSSRRTC